MEPWKPTFDLRHAQIEQHIMETPPSHQSLKALLQRSVKNFPEDIKLKVEVLGIYGLPDEWALKAVSICNRPLITLYRMTLPSKPLTMKLKFWALTLKVARYSTRLRPRGRQLTLQVKIRRAHRHHLLKLQPKAHLFHPQLKKN